MTILSANITRIHKIHDKTFHRYKDNKNIQNPQLYFNINTYLKSFYTSNLLESQ